jgi:hypothetical protein
MAFFTSSLVGNTARCSWCGKITPCSIENMRFDVQKECRGGEYINGKDAIKNGMKK